MKKIVVTTWHGSYQMIRSTQDYYAGCVELCAYSGQDLNAGKSSIDRCLEDIGTADLLLYYVTQSFADWDLILQKAKDCGVRIIYTGADAVSFITDIADLEITSKLNAYTTFGGPDNYGQMIRFAAHILDPDISYEEPKQIPWEGICHPLTSEFFTSSQEYFDAHTKSAAGVVGLLYSRSSWLNDDMQLEAELTRLIEEKGYSVLPVFAYSKADSELGSKGAAAAVKEFFLDVNGQPLIDVMIKMSGSLLIGRSEGSDEQEGGSAADLLKQLNVPVIHPVTTRSVTEEEWYEDRFGSMKDIGWSIALPEMEGVIEPILIGAKKADGDDDKLFPVSERCEKLVNRAIQWVRLHKKSNSEKKVVFILNNFPCASVEASVGGGANLDTLESLARVMQNMERLGYHLQNVPQSGKELIDTIMTRKAISEFRWTTIDEIVKKGGALEFIEPDEYEGWFRELAPRVQEQMIAAWGNPPGEEVDGVPPAMLYNGKIVVTGVPYGNALVCAQPKRGCAGARCDGTVCKILHDPSVPPTHQYLATYRYFEKKFNADVLINVGTHGNMEFLPGRGTGLTDSCYPDISVGNMPFLYIYNADNPPEGLVAKRRGLATITDHMQTVFTASGLYDSLEELNTLLEKYEKVKTEDSTQAHLLEHLIKEEIEKCNLDKQIDLTDYHANFTRITEDAHRLLTVIRNTQIQDGQHIFGQLPTGKDRLEFINSIIRYEGMEQASLRSMVSRLFGMNLQYMLAHTEEIDPTYHKSIGSILFDLEQINKNIIQVFLSGLDVEQDMDIFLDYDLVDHGMIEQINSQKDRILDINQRIEQSREIDALSDAMDAQFIQPGPSGVMTRGRDDVLPTGRNFYGIDPSSVPSKVAWEIGKRLADQLIQKYLDEEGRYPESIGYWWMCYDVFWADGEGFSQLLYLLGVRPTWRPNGRILSFEVIPLEELKRPRIDLTVKISGILRDNFREIMEMLDDAIRTVAALDEPLEENYIRKHTLENMENGGKGVTWDDAASRLFGNRPGTFGTGINLMVYASAWKEKKDFVDIYTYFAGYAYGRNRYGKPLFRQLQNNLKAIDVTYNKVISDEQDLLGCCGYFGNQGGMTVAARELSHKDVKAYYGDTREVTNVEIRSLADELRRVVRTKLLNPKWIEGQKRHGYKGAGDINKRVGRVFGWDATTDEVDDWIFDDITKTFVLDPENNQFFKENNPWALEEIARRMLEAYKRGLWIPEADLAEQLQDAYLELESWMEESMGDDVGDFQGGSIDIIDLNELDAMQKHIHHMKEDLKK